MKIKTLLPLVLVSLLAAPVMADEQDGQQSAYQWGKRGDVMQQTEQGKQTMARKMEHRGDQFHQRREMRKERIQVQSMNRHRANR